MNILLIPGLWLTGDAWRDIEGPLRSRGHHVVALDLPGQGDGNVAATLDDQVDAVLRVMDTDPSPWVIVGHSAGSKLGWLCVDRRAGSVERLVCVGGFPGGADEPYFGDFVPEEGWVTFPGWSTFEGPDIVDLSPDMRARLERLFQPVSALVTQQVMTFHDPARYDVPVTVVCPEFSSDQALEWVDAGYLPDVSALRDITYVDLESGHWPMVSCPERFASCLLEILGADSQS